MKFRSGRSLTATFAAVCFAAGALTYPGFAQEGAPAAEVAKPAPAAAKNPSPVPVVAPAVPASVVAPAVPVPAVAPAAPVPPAPAAGGTSIPVPGCTTVPPLATAKGASVVSESGQSSQAKSWQPEGGAIQFTIKSFESITATASVYACFRWRVPASSDAKPDWVQANVSQIDLSGDGKTLKVTAAIPEIPNRPDDVIKQIGIVPLADVRILAIDNKTVKADVVTQIGITHPLNGLMLSSLVAFVGLWVLYLAASYRVRHTGIRSANWLLQIISTPSGYASLSQLQIIVWTFVVACSAVYVMTLSGQLIEISSGTLVLLGIAGAAGLGAKIHTDAQTSKAQGAVVDAKKSEADAQENADQKKAALAAANTPENIAANAKAAATLVEATKAREKSEGTVHVLTTAAAGQIPKWSDLFVVDTGGPVSEVDVTRFQMLLFTIVTAVFVLISVLTRYVIPEISTGFLTLMGISNGVYIGAKVIQRSDGK